MNYSFTVKDKRITADSTADAVADNTDYTADFSFDAEWDGLLKTVRFISGKSYTDIVLENDACTLPRLGAGTVYIGVYAGNLHTTTVCAIAFEGSILTNTGTPALPAEDVYAQLLTAIDAKQDALTAGSNITISDGSVISADEARYTLPVAGSTALGGVMPVTKTSEMTQPVGSDAEGLLYTLPAGAGYRLIRQINVTEDSASVYISADTDGEEFSVSEIHVTVSAKPSTDVTGTTYIVGQLNTSSSGNTNRFTTIPAGLGTGTRYSWTHIALICGGAAFQLQCSANTNTSSSSSVSSMPYYNMSGMDIQSITSVLLRTDGDPQFGAGSVIRLYGR